MKKLRVLVLMHESLVPPESLEGYTEEEILEWKVEYDVVSTLRDMGHEVHPLGVSDDLGLIRRVIIGWKPHVAFNLLEEFHGVGVYDQNVVAYLELMRQTYTGCNPRGLLLSHDKALCKKISHLSPHFHAAVCRLSARAQSKSVPPGAVSAVGQVGQRRGLAGDYQRLGRA